MGQQPDRLEEAPPIHSQLCYETGWHELNINFLVLGIVQCKHTVKLICIQEINTTATLTQKTTESVVNGTRWWLNRKRPLDP